MQEHKIARASRFFVWIASPFGVCAIFFIWWLSLQNPEPIMLAVILLGIAITVIVAIPLLAIGLAYLFPGPVGRWIFPPEPPFD